jgi:hypothetical protein
MKFKALLFFFAIQLTVTGVAMAQTNELSAWGAWFHTQKFSNRWGASFDGQFRSAHHSSFLKNVLLRPSANYYFNKSQHLDLGYAYIATNGRTPQDVKTFRPEHRIFEQFIISHKAGLNTAVSHRFRLEQRFLGQTATQQDVFAQRFRYFVRGVIPLNKDAVFTQGTFVALQNEAFANVQNKAKINKHVFDQNRAYAAFGYRLNRMVDVEAGYLNQYIKQAETYTINHVMQVAFYTRFGK